MPKKKSKKRIPPKGTPYPPHIRGQENPPELDEEDERLLDQVWKEIMEEEEGKG